MPSGDLNAATNKLEKINGRTIDVPELATVLEDDFSDEEINTDIFDVYFSDSDLTVSETGDQIKFIGNNNNEAYGALKTKNAFDITNKFVQVKLKTLTGTECVICAALYNGDLAGKDFYIDVGSGTNKKFNFIQGFANLSGSESNGVFMPFNMGGGASYGSAHYGLNASETIFRFEHNVANGLFYWKTSVDDGENWTIERQVALSGLTAFDFTNARFAVSGGQGSSAAATIGFSEFTSSVALEDSLMDASLLWWNAALGKYEPVALTDLKAALDALP